MSPRVQGGLVARKKLNLAVPEIKVDTLVVSDIHLGSSVSRAKKLTELIEREYRAGGRYLFNRLVLLGDIFDHHDLARLDEDHWNFLWLVKKISDKKTGVEVVWLKGNHDLWLENIMKSIFTARVADDYEWDYENKRFIATHGDRFDAFVRNHPVISDFFSRLYRVIQNIDSGTREISRFVKRASKKIYLSKTVSLDMLAYARRRSADVIFCGHTHHAESARAHDGIEYYNSGCWTDVPSTYITVGSDGVNIHEIW